MGITKIGIDAGGTLVKIAYNENGTIKYRSFHSRDIDDAASWLNHDFDNPAICITGGKTQVLADKLSESASTVVEFDATTAGIMHLATEQNEALGDDFVFVNAGTGTSIHYVDHGKQERLGGSGVGGGTLMGLAYLTTGIEDYEEIVRTASEGSRENVDLKVKDIFEGAVPPISGDLTASNFGKTEFMKQQSFSHSDILAAIIGLVGEVTVSVSSQMAAQYGTETIVYIGSSFRSNQLLQEIIGTYTKMIGKKPVFLENGEYSGAVGALLVMD